MEILSAIFTYAAIVLWGFGLYLVTNSHLRPMLVEAAKMMWQKKYLWFLAFFAGLTAYGGEINFLVRQADTVTSLRALLDGIRTAITNGNWDNFVSVNHRLWTDYPWSMLGYLAVLLVLVVVIFWLIVVSQAAIIRIVGRLRQQQATGLVDGITMGIEKFWQLVQMNLIGLLLGWSVWVILTGVPAAIFLITSTQAWSIVAYIGSLLSVAISLIVIFVIQFATAGVVLHDMKVVPALVKAWDLFRNNFLSSIEMAIAIFTTNITISFVVVAVALFFIAPFSVQTFLLLMLVIVLLYALLSAFSFIAWTMYYLELTAGTTMSKLGQWTNQLVNFNKKRPVV